MAVMQEQNPPEIWVDSIFIVYQGLDDKYGGLSLATHLLSCM